jgi:hypothetical protein
MTTIEKYNGADSLWDNSYHLREMSHMQLLRALAFATQSQKASPEHSDVWGEWIVALRAELGKERDQAVNVLRGKKLKLVCFCGNKYQGRVVDLKRGWATTCSKQCAALKRTSKGGKPNARTEDGKTIADALHELASNNS